MKEKLTVDEQVRFLRDKGIKFNMKCTPCQGHDN